MKYPFFRSLLALVFLIAFQNVNFCVAQRSFSGLPFINNFEPAEYKAGIQNWQITQDIRGLIYVANNFGLLEFDGSTWNLYPVRNGTKVRSVAVQNDGRIYIGTQGDFGYFFPNQFGSYEYISLGDSVPQKNKNIDETWKVFIEDDKVYFCTFSDIFIYQDEKIQTVETNLYLEPSYFINKRLYIQSPGHPLMTMDNDGGLNPVYRGSFFGNKLITGILPFSKDHLLIVTKKSGIFKYDGNDISPWIAKNDLVISELIINCAVRLGDGKVAIGTQSNGLLLFDHAGNITLQLDIDNGLASNTVLSLFQDKNQNLWAGLNNGISHVELASPFTLIGHDMGVEGTGYAGFSHDEILYLGTNIGLYKSNEQSENPAKNKELHFSKINNTDGQVYNIQRIANGIFAGHHNGAYLIDEDEATQISTTGAWTFITNPINREKIILGTYSGISHLIKVDDDWQDTGRMFGFYESSRVMELDEDNNLWMTHGYKGAFKLKVDFVSDSILDVKFYNHNHGFPSDILINVFKIKNEILFTAERGIYKYDKEKDIFFPHPTYTKILGPNIHIRDMEEDPLGNIYFITNDQCGVIKKSGISDLEVIFNKFNKIPKLLNDDLVNVNALDMNNVVFSGKKGFIHYDANKNINMNEEFSTLIRKVHCISKGDSVLFDGNFINENGIIIKQPASYSVQLPYKSNDVRFSFSSIYYEGIEELQYRFFLRNFDDDWSSWSNKTEKEYTNLPEGEYEFLVMAKNIFGQDSELSSYKFTIDPPWYRSYIAYACYGFGAILTIALSMFFVDRRHKRDKVLMKRKQKLELTNKEEQLYSVKQQKESEIANLKNDKLNAELNHKNTELASATMNLLTKNELINEIKSKLTGIKDHAVKTETKKNIGRILKEIEASTDLDKDWQQLEFHFDRVHRDFNKRIKKEFPELTPQEMKLCIYLRLNFTTKEIAQLLHISVRGVEISRYRLRKKLNLSRDQNLSEFILAY